MANYSMTCTCGDPVAMEADSREEAVSKLQAIFTQEAVDHHLDEKHPGEQRPSMAQVHAMISEFLVAV